MNDLRNSRRNRIDLTAPADVITPIVDLLFGVYQKARTKRAVNLAEVPDYKRHIEILILDLFTAWDGDPSKYVGYGRGKRNYVREGAYWDNENDRSILTQNKFLDIIDTLAVEGFIESRPENPGFKEFSSRMRATQKLINVLHQGGLNWAYLRIDPSAPVVFVKNEEKDFLPLPESDDFDVAAAIHNLRRINSNLQSSYLALDVTDDDLDILYRLMHRQSKEDSEEDDLRVEGIREPLEFANRSLRRIFALGNFNNGGRFYGGWWQGLPSKYRKFIQIEGCVTVEMDYSTLQPRIFYAEVKEAPPEDSYFLEGWKNVPREIIKKAFNQLINSDISSKNQNQWHRFAPEVDFYPLPLEWEEMTRYQRNAIYREKFTYFNGRDYSELLHDLMELHAPIKEYFFSKSWGRMQRVDSEIAEKVMIKLLDHSPSITALPIHDSFIVRRGAEPVLHNAMMEAFREVVGVEAKIDRDEAVYDPPEGCDRKIVLARDIIDDSAKHLIERKEYHRREGEWKLAWGLGGYE